MRGLPIGAGVSYTHVYSIGGVFIFALPRYFYLKLLILLATLGLRSFQRRYHTENIRKNADFVGFLCENTP